MSMGDATPDFRIFEIGCKDISTKESRISRELEELSKIRVKNPTRVVLNRHGKATQLKKKESRAPVTKQLPPAFVMTLLKDLRQRALLHNGSCRHSAHRVDEAMRLVYGNSSHGGVQIAKAYEISPETVVAAYAGYYRVDGEMIFLHSDGSICRIPQTGEATRCACNAIHG
jgi:hypothetical protein